MSKTALNGPANRIRSASSSAATVTAAVAELKSALVPGGGPVPGFIPAPQDFAHLLAFYSTAYDAGELAAALSAAFPGTPVSGCSTAGEISPSGMTNGGVVLIAFPASNFRVHAGLIDGVGAFAVERASDVVRRLRSKLRLDGVERAADRVFAIMLADGLSNAEEMIVAAVHWAVGDVQLIGGSAGDALAFHRTSLIHDGRVVHDAAILIMVETDVPFRIFKTQNFEPTAVKLVVTAADTERRIVYELNAEPAAREYAAAIGLLPGDLGPFSFASHPLVVKVGGDYYCRSIRNMNADGSLTFFCAIDEGLVFTVADAQDMLRSTARTLDAVAADLGGICMVLGFDCILRRLDAENRQIRHEVEDLYRRHNVTGFHTYGEQFNAMHLNQTLTGIAFGAAPCTSHEDGA
ncbi:MAG: FIST N-terminal domain-containing protein [Hyphomicrobium sp.]|mgnify:CR=1 FL=1